MDKTDILGRGLGTRREAFESDGLSDSSTHLLAFQRSDTYESNDEECFTQIAFCKASIEQTELDVASLQNDICYDQDM